MDDNLLFFHYSLFLKNEQTLVVSDLHLGQEEALHNRGVLIPKTQAKDIIQRLVSAIQATNAKKIILNGDIKHEFGQTMRTEWREILEMLKILVDLGVEVVLVGGNHDMILQPIAERMNMSLVKRYQIGPYLCIHGDKIEENVPEDVHTLIMGHEHPCVGLRMGARREKFKCFLTGKYNGVDVVVTPSFSQMTEGSDVLTYTVLSPYLKETLEDFFVYVPDEEGVRCFGTVRELAELQEQEE